MIQVFTSDGFCRSVRDATPAGVVAGLALRPSARTVVLTDEKGSFSAPTWRRAKRIRAGWLVYYYNPSRAEILEWENRKKSREGKTCQEDIAHATR